MPKNKNYDYFHSKTLDLEYAVCKDQKIDDNITFSDGIKYTWKEIEALKGESELKIKIIHELKGKYPDCKMKELKTLAECSELDKECLVILKDVFDGEIVSDD